MSEAPTASLLSIPIANLETENQILVKLIHRNFNQHRCTKVFSNLHKASKVVKAMSSKDIAHLTSQAEKYLRLMQNPKVNTRDLTASLQCSHQLCKAVAIAAEAVLWFSRSARLLKPLLLQLLFIPLYTVFLGITARSLQSLSSIMLHFDSQLKALKSQILHVASVNRRHAPLVDSITPNLNYDEIATQVLSDLRVVYGPNTGDNKLKGAVNRDKTVSDSNSNGSSSNGSSSSSSGGSSGSSGSNGAGFSFAAVSGTISSVAVGSTSHADDANDTNTTNIVNTDSEYLEVRVDEDFGEVIGGSKGLPVTVTLSSKKEVKVKKEETGKAGKGEKDLICTEYRQSKEFPICTSTEISAEMPCARLINNMELFEDTVREEAEGIDVNTMHYTNVERATTDGEGEGKIVKLTDAGSLLVLSLHPTTEIPQNKNKKKKTNSFRTPDTGEKKKKKQKKDSIDDIFGDL